MIHEIQKPKYKDYSGAVKVEIGVRVQVKYEPGKKQQVTLDDENLAILAGYSQLLKKQ